MTKQPSDDLFESSSMSFGEHLEELRFALLKALSGLVVGILLGLLVANYVVGIIQIPLQNALEKFYAEKNIDALKEKYGDKVLTEDGKLLPELEHLITKDKYTYDLIYVEEEMIRRMATVINDPKATQEVSLPPPTSQMRQMRIWKKLDATITSLSVHETFMIWIKAAIISGVVFSSPWLFWQIWNFVAAGLYPHERKYVHIYIPFSLALFLAGALLAFFFVFEPVLDFLFQFNRSMNIDPDPRISEWLSFVLFLPLGFGISFQLPLVMLFIHRIGIISVETYLEKWRIAILVICVISMLLTPADPMSMLMMAVPLTVLYFGGILLCKWMPRNRSPFAEPEDL